MAQELQTEDSILKSKDRWLYETHNIPPHPPLADHSQTSLLKPSSCYDLKGAEDLQKKDIQRLLNLFEKISEEE